MSSELKVVLEPGIAQKLQFAINRNYGSLEDVEYLSTGDNFRAVSLLRTGKAKLVEAIETGSEDAVIPTTPKTWTVDDEGNIHFTLTSNGFTCEQWEQQLGRLCYQFRNWTCDILRRARELPTNGVTYHIVVCPGDKISDFKRTTNKLCAWADKKGWVRPHWEVACLICNTFTKKQLEQMGLDIVTMHKPIKDSVGNQSFLLVGCGVGGRRLHAYAISPNRQWTDDCGFAFVIPQVDLQT